MITVKQEIWLLIGPDGGFILQDGEWIGRANIFFSCEEAVDYARVHKLRGVTPIKYSGEWFGPNPVKFDTLLEHEYEKYIGNR